MDLVALIAIEDTELLASLQSKLEAASGPTPIRCRGSDLPDLLQLAGQCHPDVVLTGSGDLITHLAEFQALQRLKPAPRLLVLCARAGQKALLDLAVRAGASGFIDIPEGSLALAKAVRCVAQGENWFDRKLLYEALQSRFRSAPLSTHGDETPLTAREDQILELIGAGMSNKEIARRLDISDKTVKTHLHRIYVKLHASGRYKAYLSQPHAAPAAATLHWSTVPDINRPVAEH